MDHSMKPSEQEIHRFLQIRNEIQEEINKISPCVANLQETGKLLVSHFDVFRQISKNTQEQMPAIIQAASHTMAKTVSEDTSQLIKSMLEEKISSLDQSVENACQILNKTMGSKYRKLFLLSFLGLLLTGLISFGGGYFYAKQNTYALPADFIKMYALGLSVNKASSSPEKSISNKQTKGKDIQKNK
jgi:Mg2+ and Co2+ transporter CorA